MEVLHIKYYVVGLSYKSTWLAMDEDIYAMKTFYTLQVHVGESDSITDRLRLQRPLIRGLGGNLSKLFSKQTTWRWFN